MLNCLAGNRVETRTGNEEEGLKKGDGGGVV